MADTPQNEFFDYPDPLVLDALFKRWAANKEQVAGLNGEVGDRLKTQYELKKGFTPKGWQTYSSVRWIGLSNEAKARAEIRSIRRACDVAEAELDKNGHVGDIADMAEAAAKAEAEAKKVEAAEAETKAAATGNALPSTRPRPLSRPMPTRPRRRRRSTPRLRRRAGVAPRRRIPSTGSARSCAARSRRATRTSRRLRTTPALSSRLALRARPSRSRARDTAPTSCSKGTPQWETQPFLLLRNYGSPTS